MGAIIPDDLPPARRRGMTRWWLLLVLLTGVAGYWLGRQSLEELREVFFPMTPREAYVRALTDSPLADAVMTRLWIRAGEEALAQAPRASTPFREDGYLDPTRPAAVAYRFPARVGQRLELALALTPPSNAAVFLDLFRADSGRAPVHVASADSGEWTLAHEPGRTGEYIVRIQPELLRGGGYTLTVSVQPTLNFPVADRSVDAVQSFFGDPRDGGRRDHHGIDIFAPRGTPVVASTRGRVSRVRTTGIGGRVVWLRDADRGQSLYYAHLEAQLVEEGAEVERGDTLGLVGNSGNARSTPPHLHFGIYRRGSGPVDPLPFVGPASGPARPPELAVTAAERVRRVGEEGTELRVAPGDDAALVVALEAGVPLTVRGSTGRWLRVELPDGRTGFLTARATEAPRPVRTGVAEGDRSLRDRPGPGAAEMARLEREERVEVLGRFEDYLYVRARGREGWLAAGAPD